MAKLPIANGFYISESLPLSHQICSNVYPSTPDAPSLSEIVLPGTDGIVQMGTTGVVDQVNRGAYTKGGIPYLINGSGLYSLVRTFVGVTPVDTLTLLGVVSGEGRVSLAANNTQLMILVPGGKGYIYNEDDATPFQEITDSDFIANGAPQHVTYKDGLFVCTTDAKKIIHSNLNDGLLWSALDFGSAESDPDDTVAPIVVNNQLFITGSVTTEGFDNVGGSGFVFQRNNIFLDKGCVAPFSLITTNQTFLMIGKGLNEAPAVWQFTGNAFEKKSTKAIDLILSTYTLEELQGAFAMYSASRGAFFVYFVLPNHTLVYNLATDKWHQQTSYISLEDTRWRVNAIVNAYNLTIVTDSQDGRVGYLDKDTYTEYGTPIRRVWTTQPFSSETMFDLPDITLAMESGVGNADVPNPVVSLSISKNGKTFGPDRTRAVGAEGDFDGVIKWRRNGNASKLAVLKFTLTDAVKPMFIKLEAG